MTTKDEALQIALQALEATLETLDCANAEPGGCIADTIWHTESETLFDYLTDRINVIRKAIDTSGQRVEDSADGGREAFEAWWIANRIDAHNIKNARGFSRKVWKAAIDSVAGATDSTTGFYPVDGGSTPPRQASLSVTDECSGIPPMTDEGLAKRAFDAACPPQRSPLGKAAQQQKPVAIVEVVVPHLKSIIVKHILDAPFPNVGDFFYTSPPASKPWVGLTDAEWMNIVTKNNAWRECRPNEVATEVAKIVEAKLLEKNGGAV